jgi:hypothetical protein
MFWYYIDSQRALRTINYNVTLEPEQPEPTAFDVFNQVFVNSSPPNASTLRKANELLVTTIEASTVINTPVRQYIKKLTAGTEKLHAQSIVHKHDASNLRSRIMNRNTCSKGKRMVLRGRLHISTQELLDEAVL